MKNMNKILAVSILAITAVSSANAKIVSESLLTSTPGTYTSTNTVQAAIADAKKAGTDAAALASGKVSSVGTGSADGTISVNGSDVAVKGLKSAAYTESSAYATAAQGTLADNAVPNTRKVAGHALSADVTLSKSDVGLGNVDNTSDANKPISTATQAALDAKGTLQTAKTGTAYQNIKENIAGDNDITNQYPSIATVGALLNDLANDIGGDVGGKQNTLNSGDGGNVTYSGSGNVVTNVSANGGTVTVTKGTTLGSLATKNTVADADVASGAAISTAKSAIPSGWTNTQSAAALAAGDTVSVALGKLEKKVDSKQASGSYEAAGTASSLIGALDVSTSGGTGNVVTSVTQTDGKITVTKTAASIKDGDIASNAAISTAKSAIPTGWTNTESAAALAAGDSVSVALGKLEKKVDSKQASGSYAAASHTHATSDVTTLGGYTKGNSAAALASTDTLNAALSKLENQIDGKQASGNYVTTSRTVNGHALSSDVTVTKSDVGLGNVDNTSDANKPISTATQTALNGKQNNLGGTAGQLVATTSTAGTVAYTPAVPASIPATPSKDGMFVLTAKVVNSTPTFYWEDIGR